MDTLPGFAIALISHSFDSINPNQCGDLSQLKSIGVFLHTQNACAGLDGNRKARVDVAY